MPSKNSKALERDCLVRIGSRVKTALIQISKARASRAAGTGQNAECTELDTGACNPWRQGTGPKPCGSGLWHSKEIDMTRQIYLNKSGSGFAAKTACSRNMPHPDVNGLGRVR